MNELGFDADEVELISVGKGNKPGPGETGRSLRETLACKALRSSRSATPSHPGPGPSEREGVGSMDSRRILIKNGTVITMGNTIGLITRTRLLDAALALLTVWATRGAAKVNPRRGIGRSNAE